MTSFVFNPFTANFDSISTISLGTPNGLSLAGQVLSLGLSSTSTTGALSSTDWNRFNAITQTVPARSFYVDGSRTDTYVETGTCNYPFKDPQTAVNQIIANGDNDATHPYTIFILNQPPGGFGTLDMSSSALVSVNVIALSQGKQPVTIFNTLNITGSNIVAANIANLTITTLNLTASGVNAIVSLVGCSISVNNLSNVSEIDYANTQVVTLNLTNAPFVFFQAGYLGITGNVNLVNSTITIQGSSLLNSVVSVDATSNFLLRNGVRMVTGSITLNGLMQAYSAFISAPITIGATGTLLNRGSFIDPANITNVSGGTYTQQTSSQMIGYTPTTSANWNTVPVQVRSGLDLLAASGVAKSQSQNLVLASPNGSSGLPSFRALVAADIPSLSGTYLPLTGGTMSGIINMGSNKITSVTDPTAAQDAATKNYVDTVAAGINPAVSTQAATTSSSDLSGYSYSNGASGIGATLTAGSINAPLTVDGYTFSALGQRLLVKNHSTPANNGVYYVTQLSTALLPVILTRALDYDQPSDINNTGVIPVINGTVNANTSWLLTTLITTVGTDPLTYTQFTRNPSDYLLKANNLSDVASASSSFNNISPMTTLGDVIYGGASGVGTRLAGNTTSTKKFLTQTGTGSVSAAPGWNTIVSGDLPTITLTGDVTGAASSGSIATTIANNAVTNAKAAQMAAHTFKGNNTGSTANASDLTAIQLSNELIIAAQAISSTSIDWSTGNMFTKTLGASTTFTFTGNVSGQTIVVRLTNTASNWTVTWPAVKWAGGTPPTMSTGAVSDIYTFIYDGSNFYGSYVQNLS